VGGRGPKTAGPVQKRSTPDALFVWLLFFDKAFGDSGVFIQSSIGSNADCFKNSFDFVLLRPYDCDASPDAPDPRGLVFSDSILFARYSQVLLFLVAQNYNALKAAKLSRIGFVFTPCVANKCNSPSVQVASLKTFFDQNNLTYSAMWFIIETGCPGSWYSNKTLSRATYESFLSSFDSIFGPQSYGIYSSQQQWEKIFGDTSYNSPLAKGKKMMYANWLSGNPDNVYSSYAYGGWTKADAKNYNGGQKMCNVDNLQLISSTAPVIITLPPTLPPTRPTVTSTSTNTKATTIISVSKTSTTTTVDGKTMLTSPTTPSSMLSSLTSTETTSSSLIDDSSSTTLAAETTATTGMNGAVVGGVIGGIVLLLVVALIVACVVRRRKPRAKTDRK
jgi:hypothetical protein